MKFASRKKLIAIIMIAIVAAGFSYLFFSRNTPKAEAGWFDESWLYRQLVDITNSGSDQTDYQAMITFDSATLIVAGKMQDDCDDIRVTDINGKLLSLWIEPGTCDDSATRVWIKVPSIPASAASVYLYYGNPSAISVSSTGDTFIREISGVQGAWNMDEVSWTNDCSTGTVLDSSGNSNNGMSCPNADGTQPAPGKFGNGGFFDGSNDRVDISDNVNLQTQYLTIEAWVKGDGGGYRTIVSKDGTWFGTRDGRLLLKLNGASDQPYIANSSNVNDDLWHHVVGTYDGSYLRVYLDGQLDNTPYAFSDTLQNTGTLQIVGNNHWGGGFLWAGNVDEVRFYNRALSQDEITDLYGTGGDRQGYTTANYPNKVLVRKYSASVSVGSPSSEERGPGPVAYWKFDEGFGQTVNDSTINNNNGTLGSTAGADASDPAWQTEDMCVTGKCLKFDGADDYENVPLTSSLKNQSITVEAWVKPNTGGEIISVAQDENYHAYTFKINSNRLEVGINDWGCDILTENVISANSWQHVVFVYDNTNILAYLNGAVVPSVLPSACTATVDYSGYSNLQIGSEGNAGYFDGFIDDVKIYPYARTAAQIKTDYASRGTSSGSSVVIASEAKQSLSNGLVGYWKMDEASWNGTADEVVDASGAGNHGVAAGATHKPTTGGGKFGNGGVFDGTDDYVNIGSISGLDTTKSITLATWVKFNDIVDPTERYIIGSRTTGPNTFSLSGHNDGVRIYTQNQGRGYSEFWAVQDDTWVHLVGVREVNGSNETLKLYLNGVLVGSNTYSGLSTIPNSWAIGRLGQTDSYYHNGSIDEVRIYNRVLSSKEVSDLYNFAPGPVGHWKMDEKVSGNAKTISDSSGYGNTGTTDDGANNTGMNCAESGKIGGGCQFDGVDDYIGIDYSDSLNFTNAVTIEAWLKPSVTQNAFAGVVGREETASGWVLRYGSNNRLGGRFGNGTIAENFGSTESTPTGVWTHVALVFNGTQYIFYFNGIAESPITATIGHISTYPHTVIIASDDFAANRYFNGLIDDVHVYNYVRTQKQIVEDMLGSPKLAAASGGGALAQYKFDEGYGITANNSGFGGSALNGTLTGMSSPATATSGWTTSGKFGKALQFDGTDDVATVTNSTAIDLNDNLSSGFTVSAWVNADTAGEGSGGQIFWKGANSFLRVKNLSGGRLDVEGKLDLATTDASLNVASVIATGAWNHIVMSYDGATKITIWINGVNKGSNTGSGATAAESNNLLIGGTTTDNFDGAIDDFKIYSYELTQDEIAEEYNSGVALKLGSTSTASNGITSDNSASRAYCVPGDTSTCNPPVAYWNFDEKTGITANDISGNANAGSLGGGTAAYRPTWISGKIGGALKFDGTDDYVDAGNRSLLNFSAADNFSIFSWINIDRSVDLTVSSTYLGIYATDVEWDSGQVLNFYYRGGGAFNLRYNYGGGAAYESLTSNTFEPTKGVWHNVGVVKSGNVGYFYYDGSLIETDNTNNLSTMNMTGGSKRIGKGNANLYYFNGIIDDVKVYNYARTPAQIAWDYNRGKPVAEWKFDECQNNIAHDSSGNGNDGTITIGATGTQDGIGTCTDGDVSNAWYNGRTGKNNSALNFDGTDDYVDVGTNADLNIFGSAHSVEVWAKWTNATGNALGIASFGGFTAKAMMTTGLNNAGQDKIGYGITSSGTSTTWYYNVGSGLNDGAWHHLVVTWDGNYSHVWKFYIDGVNYSTGGAGGDTIVTSNLIGSGSATGNFKGLIDEVKIYNYELTPEQVKTEYNGGAVNFR